MTNIDSSKTPTYQRLVDIGADKQFSVTENRFLRVTNIASILGALFMVMWMITALYLTDTPILYLSNGLLALMFSLALVFNSKGWRVLASACFSATSLIGVITFLYLLGYTSGVWALCYVIIITPL